MRIEKISEEIVADLFKQGIDCSQIILGYYAEKIGISDEAAIKISSAFGGGMWRGRTCGAVTGALMALGMKYGYNEPIAPEEKGVFLAKCAKFEQKFSTENGSVICKDILLGYDLSKPEDMEKVLEKELFFTICTKLVCSTCKILDEII
jgi:C_GCAxxG_C_C family probable redox protein